MKEKLTQIQSIAKDSFSEPFHIEVNVFVEKTKMKKIEILHVDLKNEITPLFFIHSLEHFYNKTKDLVVYHFELDNCQVSVSKEGALRLSFPIDELN